MYEQILQDKVFLDVMKKISDIPFITDGKWDWEHSLGHAERVAQYIKKILIGCKCSEHMIELGMIAGLLHDIGLQFGEKTKHAEKSAIEANKYLKDFSIGISDREIIVQAIEDHSNGNYIQSIIGAALLLADKLDVSYYRVENSSVDDYINKEIMKIKRVDVEIDSKDIWIYYKTKKDFDKNVLKSWKKSFLIPIKVASYLNKECFFKINHEIIPLESSCT